jgi:hypothetical protein
MRKLFVIILCIVLFFTGCRSSVPFQDQVFGLYTLLGVVDGNTVRFYDFDDGNGWQESFVFNLPDGYKNVFVIYDLVGVVVGNTLRFYYQDSNETLGETDYHGFHLPKGYRYVFGYSEYVGVVVGNTLKFYAGLGDQWDAFFEFRLPNEYKIEATLGRFGVGGIKENTLKFYHLNDEWDGWSEIEHFAFNLPNGYISVFWFNGLFDDARIGVIVGDWVRFYDFNDNTNEWLENQPMAFKMQIK